MRSEGCNPHPMAIADLPEDFDWIVPGQVGAMSVPAPEDLFRLRQAGVTLLVSLLAEVPPAELVQLAGLRLLRLPVENWRAPTEEQICEFVAAVRAELCAGGRVAVHCYGGVGRTGTMIACYLASQGMSGQEALDHVRMQRPGSVETEEQERAIFAWAAKEDRGGEARK